MNDDKTHDDMMNHINITIEEAFKHYKTMQKTIEVLKVQNDSPLDLLKNFLWSLCISMYVKELSDDDFLKLSDLFDKSGDVDPIRKFLEILALNN